MMFLNQIYYNCAQMCELVTVQTSHEMKYASNSSFRWKLS